MSNNSIFKWGFGKGDTFVKYNFIIFFMRNEIKRAKTQ